MTAPVKEPPKRNSAPPKGAKVGVKPYPTSRWVALICHSLDDKGNVYFVWPPSHPTFGKGALAAFNIKHTDWTWAYPADCEFVKGCPKCRARGALSVNGTEKPCDRCDGTGLIPDNRPFD